ncbi:MAG: serine/threonine-protein kinase [Proteobacteria bacterium]|nr:serine/threonine-protein kinase [Pseudomonadota bacterium]
MGVGGELAIKLGDIVLDRYQVVEQIASGGHSVVYRGTDARLARPVCIKVFSGLGGQSGVGRTSYEHFVQEAFALSRLTHPNTLRIYDFGHLGSNDSAGMPLQVCEYMNAGTLSNLIREQGTQSIVETARIIGAMCAALAEAHGLGIVHRDIKPPNILFGTVGTDRLPKLADFGIAKWSADQDHDRSQRADDTAIVAGQKLAMYSPSWAAPEQLAGQPVSAATDIYSLAAVAVYMLSGKAIFSDEDVYAGYKKRRHGDELVREALEPLGVADAVIKLLSRALAFDPKKRLPRVDALASELATVLEPITEELQSLPPRHEPSRPTPPPLPRTPTPPPTTFQYPLDPPVVRAAAAPTPPAVYPSATSIHHPPLVRSSWTLVAGGPNGTIHRLPLSDVPTHVGDRRVHFLLVTNDVIDLAGVQNMKLRVSIMNTPTGRVLHLKGMTCFVAPMGGRPSPACTIEQPTDVALVTPRAQEIGHVRVLPGPTQMNGQHVFVIGNEAVTIAPEDCIDPILFDFGPGSDAYFIYTRGRTLPPKRR